MDDTSLARKEILERNLKILERLGNPNLRIKVEDLKILCLYGVINEARKLRRLKPFDREHTLLLNRVRDKLLKTV